MTGLETGLTGEETIIARVGDDPAGAPKK